MTEGVNERRSILAVLQSTATAAEFDRVRQCYRAANVLAPRLLILDADNDLLAQLREERIILGIYQDEVPVDILADLRPEEALFASAWSHQRTMHRKPRTGEGLSWDTPPFEPPDPPRKTTT